MIALILRAALPCVLAAAPVSAAELKPWTGGPAPVLELRGLDGAGHRLADYRGRVVLVNFWATWCEPCRDEMPSMQRLKEKLAGKPFAVLAVNLDEPESRIRQFLSRMKVDFTVLLDPGKKAARAWDARILPASFVIGVDGKIHYSLVGELDWDHERVVDRLSKLFPSRGLGK
ncbi:MAG TPA: TlpA disulfide reductase family protein [Burkholderiales bacterium]|nr:TlpA disulfide reductase family protein [Burkholderiales bacterium]